MFPSLFGSKFNSSTSSNNKQDASNADTAPPQGNNIFSNDYSSSTKVDCPIPTTAEKSSPAAPENFLDAEFEPFPNSQSQPDAAFWRHTQSEVDGAKDCAPAEEEQYNHRDVEKSSNVHEQTADVNMDSSEIGCCENVPMDLSYGTICEAPDMIKVNDANRIEHNSFQSHTADPKPDLMKSGPTNLKNISKHEQEKILNKNECLRQVQAENEDSCQNSLKRLNTLLGEQQSKMNTQRILREIDPNIQINSNENINIKHKIIHDHQNNSGRESSYYNSSSKTRLQPSTAFSSYDLLLNKENENLNLLSLSKPHQENQKSSRTNSKKESNWLDSQKIILSNKLLINSGDIYIIDIFRTFFMRQFDLMPKLNFMNRQHDINISMRYKLVDWIIEVVDELKMSKETLYTCINLIDRFLSRMAVLRGKLQLVGTTSLLICSKFEEIHPPDVKVFSYVTENSYTNNEILRMEGILLRAIKFDICVPTITHFTQFILNYAEILDKSVTNLTDYLGELILLEYPKLTQHPPAILAFASVSLALHSLSQHPWNSKVANLADSVGLLYSDIFLAMTEVYKIMQASVQAKCNIYTKFSSSDYDFASQTPLPRTLPVLYPVNIAADV